MLEAQVMEGSEQKLKSLEVGAYRTDIVIELLSSFRRREDYTCFADYARKNRITMNELWLKVLDEKYDEFRGMGEFRDYVNKP